MLLLLIVLIIALFTLGFGIIMLYAMSHQKKQFGVLTGKQVYQDTQEKPGKTLYAKTIPLIGKPDYIIEEQGVLIPVEVKTGKTPSSPYTNHTMQLMAYCFLIEETYGIRPPGGYLKYPEKEFKLAYTQEAKQSVINLVKEILHCKQTTPHFTCTHKEHNLAE